MSREPIFGELADGLSRTIRQRHPRHAVSLERDCRELPVFAATVKACGWDGPPVRITADETAVFAAVS